MDFLQTFFSKMNVFSDMSDKKIFVLELEKKFVGNS